MAKKTEQNSRERRAAERAATGITAKAPAQNFVNVSELREILEPRVREFDCVLESMTAKGKGAHQTLEIVVDYTEDHTEFPSLDTIAEISQTLSVALDEADDGDSPYALEVSSPGADRALSERRHWKRSRGRLINVVPVEGESFLARLEEVFEDGPQLCRKKNTKKGQKESYKDLETLPWNAISSAKVEIEFNH